MTPEIRSQIGRAANQLQIEDVVLHRSRFDRNGESKSAFAGNARVQHKTGVGFATVPPTEAGGADKLHVLVAFGVRLVPESAEGDADDALESVLCLIEADFLVIFRLTGEVDEPCLKAFSDHNAVHNAWPFWRQHVFDVTSRARLPTIPIPLYRRIES